ncbi:MAG: hypothetical protein ABJL44_18430 [Algibacter sp.]
MKQNNANYTTQSLNPFLGFGWYTGTSHKKKILVSKNQEDKKRSCLS